MANPALVSPPTLFTNREGRMMLTESDLVTLDRRAFQHEVARYLAQLQAQPVPLSVVRNGKDFAEAKLLSLRRTLEVATLEERPRLEEEIAQFKAGQAPDVTQSWPSVEKPSLLVNPVNPA
jgi:hypothetical protein